MISIQKGLSKDEGVSPVIGVILLVAITVILAAVIAAFVFGYAGSMGKTKVVSATFEQTSATDGLITFMGGKDTADLVQLDILTTGSVECGDDLITGAVGEVEACHNITSGDTITIVGVFPDTKQVILTKTF